MKALRSSCRCKILLTATVASDLLIYSETFLSVWYITGTMLSVGDIVLTITDIVFTFKELLEGKHMCI